MKRSTYIVIVIGIFVLSAIMGVIARHFCSWATTVLVLPG